MSILKRLVDYLAPAGFILAVGATAWTRFTPFGHPLPGGLRPWLIAAAALVLVHLILRWEDATPGLQYKIHDYPVRVLQQIISTDVDYDVAGGGGAVCWVVLEPAVVVHDIGANTIQGGCIAGYAVFEGLR